LEVGEEVKKGDQITSVIGKQLVDKITTQTMPTTIKSIQEKISFFFVFWGPEMDWVFVSLYGWA
jgi:hypothetical protein